MRIKVVGNTDSIINLNKNGVPIQGRTVAVINADTQEKINEINGLCSYGLIRIIEDAPPAPVTPPVVEAKVEVKEEVKEEKNKKGGRPKGSKNKTTLAQIEKEKVTKAEAETQKMGSRVVVSTGDGVREGRMRKSVVDDLSESEKTRESIQALEQLEKEEGEVILPDRPVENHQLDPSEQMGRKAVVSSAQGENKVDMQNSILPNSAEIKARSPFVDGKHDDPEFDESFIKI